MSKYTHFIPNPETYSLVSYVRRYAIEIVDELSRTSKSSEKVEILRKAFRENQGFTQGLFLCYNPVIKFGIKKIPEWKPALASAFALERILKDLNIFIERSVTGNRAIEKLKDLLEMSESADAEFLTRVIARDMDCGINVGLINKAHQLEFSRDLIPEFPVMLCSAFDSDQAKKWAFPAIVQTKMDGMRIAAIVNRQQISFHTRNGNSFDDIPDGLVNYINQYLTPAVNQTNGYVLDGEMLVVNEDGSPAPRKEGNGVLTRLIRGTSTPEDRARLRFVVWDIIPLTPFWEGKWDVEYSNRYNFLVAAVQKALLNSNSFDDPLIRIVKSSIVSDFESAMKIYNEELSNGNEGVIIKSLSGPWKNTRAKWQMKLKAEIEMDARVVGVIEGTGKYQGMMGALECEASDADGVIRFNVGTGFTDAERVELWQNKPLDKTINVRYNEIIKSSDGSRSLFLPVFVEIRSDIGPLKGL